MYRVGFGYDVHQLKKGRPFYLGGILIPHTHGPLAHSDGDVLIHALCDALLGAASLRDIGFHFPDSEEAFKNADSKTFLSHTIQLLIQKKLHVVNADVTLLLEAPKVSPHINDMKKTLAPILKINESELGIKATTQEGLGFVGKRRGIAAYAVVLLRKEE
jgi:2-C-methyl-D-erythritol 2,4-cyclodiphosphate synthase